MVSTTLLLGSLLTILEGLGYLAVAALFGQRTFEREARTPARLFQAWWYLIGANKLLAAGAGLLAVYDFIDVRGYASILYVNLVVLCVSLWCLLSYLSFLMTGRRRGFYWAAALYIGYYLLLTYNLSAGRPVAVGEGEWRTFLVSEVPSSPLRSLASLVLLVAPQSIAALVYFTLVFRVKDALARRRILLVSLSIVGWTASVFLVAAPGFQSSAVMQVGSRIVGVASALLGLAAYRTPARYRPAAEPEPLPQSNP